MRKFSQQLFTNERVLARATEWERKRKISKQTEIKYKIINTIIVGMSLGANSMSIFLLVRSFFMCRRAIVVFILVYFFILYVSSCSMFTQCASNADLAHVENADRIPVVIFWYCVRLCLPPVAERSKLLHLAVGDNA